MSNAHTNATSDIGVALHQFITDLYPICRSITGDGMRATLRQIATHIPLTFYEVASGTPVFDWVIPNEWNIRDAYVKNSRGERVIDFQQSNLHVVNYSVPIHKQMTLAELKEHLFTVPNQPDWIPYRTSYYRDFWGFCTSHRQMLELTDEEYEVCIDSSLEPGALSYGECYLPGTTSDEVLISCHACHPSLCNDNLSGVALATFLAHALSTSPRRYSYRFLFIPGTIGSITWLAQNEAQTTQIKHGLVVTCVGDPGRSTYKKSRRSDAEIDRVVAHVFQHSGTDYEIQDFTPYGYDERQYCSPGFNLPVGCLMRTPHGCFPEYHTSADNLDFVSAAALSDSFTKLSLAVSILEQNRVYISRNQKCEPRLGRRGLYRMIGGEADGGLNEQALLWMLNLADGQHSLLAIAERAHMPFDLIHRAANALLDADLLEEFAE